MKSAVSSFYWRIVGLYLFLLLAFCAVATVLAAKEFEGFLAEVEQRLNRNLATHLAHELGPALNAEDREGVRQSVRRITGINPSIDIYVLSSTGVVTASFTGKPILRDHVEIAKIKAFLAKDASLPIRATDPGDPKEDKVFSAAPIATTPGGAYLYAILPGMPFESAAHMVRTSYVLRGGASVLGAVLLAALLAGLLFFFILTRRFERLTHTVNKFKEGAFHERAQVVPNDQIGRLAATFNEMAATIESQFQALKQTDEARRTFASNISHDFRTPLTALRGYTDRLLRAEEHLDPTERRQHLDAVLKSAAQLEHLADQLAIIVQLDGSSDYILKKESFSIAELAQDAVLKFMPFAEKHGVTIVLLNPENVPYVMGDIALVERALANLLDNAIKNSASGGRIEISLPFTGPQVTVCIRDSGFGITAEELPFLKQRFFRTIKSRASDMPGSGLGLAIVEDIVARHGGTLHVESTVGVGSTFSFSLPASGPG